MADEPGDAEYGLVMPFWLDTDAYTARDRLMFCAGYEFQTIYAALQKPEGFRMTIHRENESRARMCAGALGRRVEIAPLEDFDEWSDLKAFPQDSSP